MRLSLLALVAALALPAAAKTRRAVPAIGPAAVPGTAAPGAGLSPEFSDPGRVRLILGIVAAVHEGRPLPFPQDGGTWADREGRLPAKPLGYYKEYTVLPPAGSPSRITVGGRPFDIAPPQGHRGVERLIIGGGEKLYYTPDHYRTFIELAILRP